MALNIVRGEITYSSTKCRLQLASGVDDRLDQLCSPNLSMFIEWILDSLIGIMVFFVTQSFGGGWNAAEVQGFFCLAICNNYMYVRGHAYVCYFNQLGQQLQFDYLTDTGAEKMFDS